MVGLLLLRISLPRRRPSFFVIRTSEFYSCLSNKPFYFLTEGDADSQLGDGKKQTPCECLRKDFLRPRCE